MHLVGFDGVGCTNSVLPASRMLCDVRPNFGTSQAGQWLRSFIRAPGRDGFTPIECLQPQIEETGTNIRSASIRVSLADGRPWPSSDSEQAMCASPWKQAGPARHRRSIVWCGNRQTAALTMIAWIDARDAAPR